MKDIAFAHPLVLHIRNDTFGEPITLGTRVASGASTTLGVIEPGECVSLPLETLSGVFAICALETTVSCFLH